MDERLDECRAEVKRLRDALDRKRIERCSYCAERMRVNVGLVMENKELRRTLAGQVEERG